jgi:hypothetical protein
VWSKRSKVCGRLSVLTKFGLESTVFSVHSEFEKHPAVAARFRPRGWASEGLRILDIQRVGTLSSRLSGTARSEHDDADRTPTMSEMKMVVWGSFLGESLAR